MAFEAWNSSAAQSDSLRLISESIIRTVSTTNQNKINLNNFFTSTDKHLTKFTENKLHALFKHVLENSEDVVPNEN